MLDYDDNDDYTGGHGCHESVTVSFRVPTGIQRVYFMLSKVTVSGMLTSMKLPSQHNKIGDYSTG